MSRSFDVQINARRIMFVNSCINVIIITLFYTNCTRGLAKTILGYTKRSQKKFLLGAAAPPTYNNAPDNHAAIPQ